MITSSIKLNESIKPFLVFHLSHVPWMQHHYNRLWLLWTNWLSVMLHFKCVFTHVVLSFQRLSEVCPRLPALTITAGEQLKSENWCSTQEGAVLLLTREVVEVKAPHLAVYMFYTSCVWLTWREHVRHVEDKCKTVINIIRSEITEVCTCVSDQFKAGLWKWN